MKKEVALVAVLLSALGVACGDDTSGFSDDDDDGGEDGGGALGSGASNSNAGGSGGTGGSGGSGGSGGTEEHPDGPQFLSFGTNVTTIYENESVTFTAVLTDPDGVEDLIGGSLLDGNGAQYGAFSTSGQEGSYEMTVSWGEIQQIASINFAYGAAQSRSFVAEFWDVAGHVSTIELELSLSCSNGAAGCDGSCIDTMNDDYNCGSCFNSCNDDLCMWSASCSAGTCVGETVDCSWMDGECSTGTCDSGTGDCVANNLPNNTSCTDGDACTTGDVCTTGTCGGTPISGGTVFSEDFSDNSAGWTLGTEWGIAAATTSTGHESYNPDPSADNSSTADDGVAGANIGGNINKASTHGYYYLTSPSLDASSSTGTLTLSFYRWLNSDYTPYMQNIVEVWNGSSWVTVWESGATEIDDSSWTLQTYDITAHQNASLQVRFGHAVLDTTAYVVSGWNIDDVVISSDDVCGG